MRYTWQLTALRLSCGSSCRCSSRHLSKEEDEGAEETPDSARHKQHAQQILLMQQLVQNRLRGISSCHISREEDVGIEETPGTAKPQPVVVGAADAAAQASAG